MYQTKYQRCLGIDPGLANCGWAVVHRGVSKHKFVASGCLHTPKSETLGSRLLSIYAGIRQILTEHAPELVCIEAVFFNKNVTSCISTASVIAIIELASAQVGILCLQVKPQTVKSAAGLGGRASKSNVQKMMGKLLGEDICNNHEADAAAAAIAGLLTSVWFFLRVR